MRWIPAVAFLALLTQAPAPCAAESDAGGRFDVSLPMGGCRLTLFPDGSGRIHYGAAPHVASVPPRTFDHATLLQAFRRDALIGMEQAGASDEAATASVVLPDSNIERPLRDSANVRTLLERGWRVRLPPKAGLGPVDAHAWLARACDFR